MCGVPYHAAEGYIARLIQKGYRVAICDQMEDPRFAKKLVKRELTRIVTPGTATDAQAAAVAREQLPGGGGARRQPRRRGARGCLHRRVPRHGNGRRRGGRRARAAGRARGAGPGRAAAARRPRARGRASSARRSKTGSSATTTPTARCASTSSCSRSTAAAWRAAALAVARGGRHPALPARNAARRARSPGPARVLRPRRSDGARRGHGAQPGTGGAAVRRRRPAGLDAGQPCSTRPLTGMGGAPAAAAAAAPVAWTAAEIEARLDAVGELAQRDHPARRAAQGARRRCWTWSGCWPR